MKLNSTPSAMFSRVLEILQWPEVWVSLFLFFFLHHYHKQRNKPLPSWPLLNNLPSLLANYHRLHEWMHGVVAAEGGTMIFRGPVFTDMHIIATSDPRNIEYILKSNFENFPKGKEFSDAFLELMGSGIFNSDAESWLVQRKMANAHVHSKLFHQFMARTTQEIVESQLIPILKRSAQSEQPIDIQDVLLRFTFDATCKAVFGESPRCLSFDFPSVPFAEAINNAMESIAFRYVVPASWWRTLRSLNLWKERKLSRAIVVINEFVIRQIILRKNHGLRGNDLLSIYAEKSDEVTFLRDTAVNFLIAGRDTSGTALSWFFWNLSNHPHVEAKILEEVREVLREKKRESLKPEDLDKLVYLHAALSESLRLYPSVPIGQKGVVKEATLPSGTVVKPGMVILYLIYAVGRMEWVWGKDSLEFKPERWIDEAGKLRYENNSYRFLAFNGGPRTCVGRDIAFVQMKLAAALVLLNFTVRVEEGQSVAPLTSVILNMKNRLMVRVEERPKML
ncbi:Cytochrome P450 52A2 [Nymphaea thermarum]|nr:Cytochrome P450 52A2 [Nymphaea thermarum]